MKKLFTKAKESGGDPHLAMLCLRTTPIDHNLPSPCELLNGRRYKSNLTKVTNKASTPRSYNILPAQGTAYRRNRQHLRDTQEGWKEPSSNNGINDDLEDDRAAAHPGAIPQPESPVAISHTQRVEAWRSSRVSKPPNRLDL